MKKNIIIVTGGDGFVGSNLIENFIKKTKYKIISIDNYSSGFRKNHINSLRVKYIKGHTKDIEKLIKTPKKIKSIFHFGEFSRIYQSFNMMDECINLIQLVLIQFLTFATKIDKINLFCYFSIFRE